MDSMRTGVPRELFCLFNKCACVNAIHLCQLVLAFIIWNATKLDSDSLRVHAPLLNMQLTKTHLNKPQQMMYI